MKTTQNRLPTELKELVSYLESLNSRASVDRLGQLLSDCQADLECLDDFVIFGEKTYRRKVNGLSCFASVGKVDSEAQFMTMHNPHVG